MDLKRLNHLIALAEERHFGRAATRVHISQPAFSRSVQAAEAELGLQLFERGNAEVACTPAGAFFIERARKLVFENRRLERDVDLYRKRVIGDVAFGASPFSAATLLTPLIVDLRTRFPAVRSKIHINNLRYLVDCLHKEEIDFFVADTRDVPADASFGITKIGQQRARFYVRSSHPLALKAGVSLAEVMECGLATGRLPAQAEAGMRKLLDEVGSLPIAVECDDVQLVKRITLATDTVMVGSEGTVREELASGLLLPLQMQDFPRSYAELGIVSLRGRSYSPMAEYAVDFLTRLARLQESQDSEAAGASSAS